MIKDFFNFSKLESYTYPYNHWVIDRFMEQNTAEDMFFNFPKVDEKWFSYDNFFEKKKHTIEDISSLVKAQKTHGLILALMNTRMFIDELEKITGIDGLIPDPGFRGGGLHQTLSGGKLDIHADFNIHPKLKVQRRLNALLYLNKGWEEHWGGHLELWEKDMSKCAVKITPSFNKLVIFETNDDSFHGHPEPLTCPPNVTRKSLALYYYTAIDKDLTPHAALFQKRPGEETTEEVEEFRQKRNKGSK